MPTRVTISCCLLGGLAWLGAARPAGAEGPPLREFFRGEVERIERAPLAGIASADDWKARRPGLQRRLREMLGLDPEPPRTDLHATITGTAERPDFVVEKLHFQSRPGLYVTANLYRPKEVQGPLPTILYLCGHAEVEGDGVIYGNKAHYQHHAAWYAANGYVCLVLDTLQLGELPGLHHGTGRFGMWWWLSRGYTPAGVEAWNAIRAVDYLLTRPEVDPARIGVTGRSGGGIGSWWVGALDDRVAAVAPVAGITDLREHVSEPNADGKYDMGVVEGHCDCMYFVNLERWDYDTLAALVAPKPLLIENSDHDPIFPLAGVRRIYGKLEEVYRWYGAPERLALVVGRGGHVDTPEIRHASFAFFERVLKGRDVKPGEIDEPDRRVPVELLKVLPPGETPDDCRNATAHEWFVPRAEAPPVPKTAAEWSALRDSWLASLRSGAFGGWPRGDDVPALDVKRVVSFPNQGAAAGVYGFTSQPGVRLRLWLTVPEDQLKGPLPLVVTVLDEAAWRDGFGAFLEGLERNRWDEYPQGAPLARVAGARPACLAYVAPRGVGPTGWPEGRQKHMLRRFALLGQTLDGQRAWDVVRALEVLRDAPDLAGSRVELLARGDAAIPALAAALADERIVSVHLIEPPSSWRDAPPLLGAGRLLDPPQAVALLAPRDVRLYDAAPEPWSWASQLGRTVIPSGRWPRFAVVPPPASD